MSSGTRPTTETIPLGLPDVTCEVRGPVATITIDRPESRNAVRVETVEALGAAARELARRPDVTVAVLTGSGSRFFCPGADLSSGGGAGEGETPPDSASPEVWRLRAPVELQELPQITVAAVNGACAGAGFGFATACDIRVATRSARFATAFLDVAVAGDMGLPWTLSRILGEARAKELFLLEGKFGADEALAMGLVSAVYPDVTFRDEVDALVGRLAAYKGTALRTLKENFLSAGRLGFGDYLDLEHERHMRLVTHPDFRAAAERFRKGTG